MFLLCFVLKLLHVQNYNDCYKTLKIIAVLSASESIVK